MTESSTDEGSDYNISEHSTYSDDDEYSDHEQEQLFEWAREQEELEGL